MYHCFICKLEHEESGVEDELSNFITVSCLSNHLEAVHDLDCIRGVTNFSTITGKVQIMEEGTYLHA